LNAPELRFLHHEIGLLKEENQNQNIEISLLKEVVTESNQGFKEKGKDVDPESIKKRPARLLPARFLYGEKNNSNVQPTFYGPPTNCLELSKLGYTLNGFYQVKPNSSQIADEFTQLETVYCAFKQPAGTFNESKVEKRVIIAKLKVKNDVEKARKKAEVGRIQWTSNLKEKDDDDFQYQERTSTFRSILSTGSSNNLKVDNRINFYARATSNKIVLHDLDAIKFNELLLNLGNAFDAASGVFTASKSGLYQFVIQGGFVLTKHVDNVFFYITVLRNGIAIDYIIFTNYNYHSPRSLVVAYKLAVGDKIRLKYFKSEQSKHVERIILLDSFMFSGSLLGED